MKPQLLAIRVASFDQGIADAPVRVHASALGKPGLVGLLVAASELEVLPARPWCIEAALERLSVELDQGAEPGGPLAAALSRWQVAGNAARSRFPGLRSVVAGLVSSGALAPDNYAFTVDTHWRAVHANLLDLLPTTERAAAAAAAQTLVAMATISSKQALTPSTSA